MTRPWPPLLAALLCAAGCSDLPESPGDDPIRIVRGASPKLPEMPFIAAPIVPSIPASPAARLEAAFDAVADARAEASQTEARSRDLYRIGDSIVAEGGTVPDV